MSIGYSELWPVHAILMSLSFALMVIGMILSFQKSKKWRLDVHKKLSMTGAILGIIALAIAVYMISASYGLHFSVFHSIIGIITLALILLTPFFGYAVFKTKKLDKKQLRSLHLWVGRVTLVLMVVTIVAGLRLVGIL